MLSFHASFLKTLIRLIRNYINNIRYYISLDYVINTEQTQRDRLLSSFRHKAKSPLWFSLLTTQRKTIRKIERLILFQNIFYVRENLKFKKSRRPKIKKSENRKSKTQLLDSKFETFQILRINNEEFMRC